MNSIQYIANLIEQQFPEFYRTDSQDFIQFLKAYYEWQDSISKTRSILDYMDIDTTPDEYLDFFRKEYMSGIPKQILGDKRLLQKHILNLYNSKGSVEGIRLVFRLLYNEEIEYYVPAEDIFKLDNSYWYEPKYLEVSKFETNYQFVNQNIIGVNSGARAIVESYERRNVNGKIIDLLFISNIQGTFSFGEQITFDGITIEQPSILGSIVQVIVNSATPGFKIGDEVEITTATAGKYFSGLVSGVRNGGQGVINFVLEDGGNGYTMNSAITITSGSNTAGSGAAFIIGSLANTYNLAISFIKVNPYLNVALSANSYAANVSDISGMATANLSTPIFDHLDTSIYTFGKIARIITTNPGSGYDGSVSVSIQEPLSLALHKPDGHGNFYGNDAVVSSSAFYGNGVPTAVKIINSGLNYYANSMNVTMTNVANAILNIDATIIDGGVGTMAGYWKDTTSFLDSDKYLQDDDYYQEFSYELILRKRLEEYYYVLKNTVHPSGNKVFGKVRLITEN
jgi:hypothetical protein